MKECHLHIDMMNIEHFIVFLITIVEYDVEIEMRMAMRIQEATACCFGGDFEIGRWVKRWVNDGIFMGKMIGIPSGNRLQFPIEAMASSKGRRFTHQKC